MRLRDCSRLETDLPMVEGCLLVCPECSVAAHYELWQETSVGCEDCGEHSAIRCPNCEEAIDLVYAESFQVVYPPGLDLNRRLISWQWVLKHPTRTDIYHADAHGGMTVAVSHDDQQTWCYGAFDIKGGRVAFQAGYESIDAAMDAAELYIWSVGA